MRFGTFMEGARFETQAAILPSSQVRSKASPMSTLFERKELFLMVDQHPDIWHHDRAGGLHEVFRFKR